ncbi:MAG: Arc family DNA-binding protein [Oscillospiraceae bacterium]|nr:Arc family DNA-binding protein [Oscillospiraceae bacterium]MBQ4544171.1 Arc family DNA-binding protein [Oscillospiraceae bacterium]
MPLKISSIRMESELLEKLHAVAEYEGRSANGQIMVLVRKCIEEFESEHGEIKLGK